MTFLMKLLLANFFKILIRHYLCNDVSIVLFGINIHKIYFYFIYFFFICIYSLNLWFLCVFLRLFFFSFESISLIIEHWDNRQYNGVRKNEVILGKESYCI